MKIPRWILILVCWASNPVESLLRTKKWLVERFGWGLSDREKEFHRRNIRNYPPPVCHICGSNLNFAIAEFSAKPSWSPVAAVWVRDWHWVCPKKWCYSGDKNDHLVQAREKYGISIPEEDWDHTEPGTGWQVIWHSLFPYL